MQSSLKSSHVNQKSEFIRLSVTLFLIAGIMSLIVALVNNITEPVIANINIQKTEQALAAVLPDADGFTDISADVKLPDTVEGVWQAENGAGYCVKVCPQGYGGEIETIVGFDAQGAVVGTEIVSLSETSGIGTKIESQSFLEQFVGLTASADSVSAISGATVSSTAFISGVDAAMDVVSSLVGGEG